MNNIKRISKFFIIFFIFIVLFACNKNNIDLTNFNAKVVDYNLFNGNEEIILPKNQIEAQNLSVIVKNDNNELIIFDGGRFEDAEYLYSIIKSLGGNVNAWFLTHIHDDHIGALYEILKNKYYDININNLYFNFASFDWYYEKIGIDAGALNVFLSALNEYNDNAINKINICSKLNKGDIFNFSDMNIEVLNDIYLLDEDSINNTSMVYKISNNDFSMIVLGDLGYTGGEKLINETKKEKLKSDVCVLSHHGQNGVPLELYGIIEPKVCIWPTTKAIYENINKKYTTDDTKKYLNNMGVKNVVSYLETIIIK